MTIAQHRRTPEISLDAHVRRTLVALGEALASRTAVYLDTKYWVLLRQAAAGAPKGAADTELLALLRDHVASGTVFCPISESIFLELMKQTDPSSRIATAKLIDDLSLGVTLIEPKMRVGTEIAYLIHSRANTRALHPIEHLVWCKLTYVLGLVHPTSISFDSDTQIAIQRAFFDHMWAIPLREMLSIIGHTDFGGAASFEALAETLNASNAAHANALRSFQQAYSAEVRGIVDLVGSVALDVVDDMAREQGVSIDERSEADRLVYEHQLKALLALALEKDKARDVLRTLHIQACLHASVRWNRGRKLVANDLLDFNHAAAALAYCDAFFTDGPLRSMVMEKHIALDKRYGCRVIAEEGEAVEFLRQLG